MLGGCPSLRMGVEKDGNNQYEREYGHSGYELARDFRIVFSFAQRSKRPRSGRRWTITSSGWAVASMNEYRCGSKIAAASGTASDDGSFVSRRIWSRRVLQHLDATIKHIDGEVLVLLEADLGRRHRNVDGLDLGALELRQFLCAKGRAVEPRSEPIPIPIWIVLLRFTIGVERTFSASAGSGRWRPPRCSSGSRGR